MPFKLSSAVETVFSTCILSVIALTLLVRETYFLEPLDRHPLGHTHPGYQPSHNMIMYKMRDVNYTLPRTHCEVGTSEKMRKVQVTVTKLF